MSNHPITLKVDVTKLDKSIFFRSQKTGAVYVDLVAWPNDDGLDQYGNSHRVYQSRPKGEPDKKMPIVGNMKITEFGDYRGNRSDNDDITPASLDADDVDDIPF